MDSRPERVRTADAEQVKGRRMGHSRQGIPGHKQGKEQKAAQGATGSLRTTEKGGDTADRAPRVLEDVLMGA